MSRLTPEQRAALLVDIAPMDGDPALSVIVMCDRDMLLLGAALATRLRDKCRHVIALAIRSAENEAIDACMEIVETHTHEGPSWGADEDDDYFVDVDKIREEAKQLKTI